jgi:hypothetical protein
LICQFRVSDHSLGIERGRYYKIPRLSEKCGVVDDEAHFFLYCTINDRLRTAFLDDLLYLSRINTLNDIDKIENILNSTSSQVKSLPNIGSKATNKQKMEHIHKQQLSYTNKQKVCFTI